MAAIKRFFAKKKMDVKFKVAGEGHKLTEDTRSVPSVSREKSQVTAKKPVNKDETKKAADAALARMSQGRPDSANIGSSMAAVKRQVSQEMQAERKAAAKSQALAELYSAPKEVELEGAPVLAVSGVFFKCPMIGPDVLPQAEMETHIHEFLLTQLAEEPQMTSALMIYTLNKDQEKVKVCVDTINKYLDNIIANPTEEKYRKIRINNKAFQERILPLQGTQEFLQSAGFQMKLLPGPNEVDEDFYLLSAEYAKDSDGLSSLKDILLAAEPIKPELDHNLKVFYGSSGASRMQVPEEFYSVGAEDIKKEQQLRQEAVERLGMLRTKEMRERERQKELRKYRYTLIRVRFPDGVLLQGTFRAQEKLKALYDLVRESIQLDWIPFHLTVQTGHKLTEEDLRLAELDLAPAALVNFAFDKTVLAEVTAQKGSSKIDTYLKEELMQQIQSL